MIVTRPSTHCYLHCDRFQKQAKALGVPADALYKALLADAELQPPNWDLHGRQANIWKRIGEFSQ